MNTRTRTNEPASIRRVGFVGTRFAGTDGVSLEVEKWAVVLARLGIESVYFAGRCDRAPERSFIAPNAFFEAPRIAAVQRHVFGTTVRTRALTDEIHALREELKSALYRFVEAFAPDALIIQNASAIPMNIPLGAAIAEFIAETGLPCIAHHHDFAWERDRFRPSCVDDIIAAAFPPRHPAVHHVVINREAQRRLAFQCGLTSTLVPNVFDFAQPAPGIDAYNNDLRAELAIDPEELLFLQPTRIIARKGIEHAIELVARLNRAYESHGSEYAQGTNRPRRVRLVIPHHELDEGDEYAQRIVSYAAQLHVPLMVRPDRIGLQRGTDADGRRIYSLWDLYAHADFVTYPSLYEGFGNAFVEAVYFRKPIFANRYAVYREDIEPCGFQAVTIDGHVTDESVAHVQRLIESREERERVTEINAQIGARHFSYETLETRLRAILSLM